MERTLALLPFPIDSLVPFYSRDTQEYHHDKYHSAFLDKLVSRNFAQASFV